MWSILLPPGFLAIVFEKEIEQVKILDVLLWCPRRSRRDRRRSDTCWSLGIDHWDSIDKINEQLGEKYTFGIMFHRFDRLDTFHCDLHSLHFVPTS